jgi:hypothetical protein
MIVSALVDHLPGPGQPGKPDPHPNGHYGHEPHPRLGRHQTPHWHRVPRPPTVSPIGLQRRLCHFTGKIRVPSPVGPPCQSRSGRAGSQKNTGRVPAMATTWASVTNQVLALREHLIAEQVTLVVMEATGDNWKSIRRGEPDHGEPDHGEPDHGAADRP